MALVGTWPDAQEEPFYNTSNKYTERCKREECTCVERTQILLYLSDFMLFSCNIQYEKKNAQKNLFVHSRDF